LIIAHLKSGNSSKLNNPIKKMAIEFSNDGFSFLFSPLRKGLVQVATNNLNPVPDKLLIDPGQDGGYKIIEFQRQYGKCLEQKTG
jgi:hypothetical protein